MNAAVNSTFRLIGVFPSPKLFMAIVLTANMGIGWIAQTADSEAPLVDIAVVSAVRDEKRATKLSEGDVFMVKRIATERKSSRVDDDEWKQKNANIPDGISELELSQLAPIKLSESEVKQISEIVKKDIYFGAELHSGRVTLNKLALSHSFARFRSCEIGVVRLDLTFKRIIIYVVKGQDQKWMWFGSEYPRKPPQRE